MMAASLSSKVVLAQQQTGGQVAPATPPQTGLAPTPAPPAPGPVPWMSGLDNLKPPALGEITADMVAVTETRFFTGLQMATLRHLCDLLVPPWGKYPGALEAGAPEFLDFLIGASPLDRQQLFQGGLDRLDRESNEHFHKAFAALAPAEADTLIRPWLRTWMTDHPPTEPYARFINLAHADIRTATINSQAWAQAADAQSRGEALYWFPVDPDLRRKLTSAPGLAPNA
ncbi:gluconate 2-dehydrogenase subunit 3 family protein [Acidipila sp. EB88]|nr:gluconate 2-dehydrogenase subunit 3 family protein [Acidipila sp. EB88]